MSKNILLLVTGGTPQIITETIWALACDPQHNEQWVPDEVHIISTRYGLNEVKNKLLGKDKILTRMKNEYAQIANLRLEENFLHCFTDQEGNELEDLRTPEENEFAANLICEKIRHFSSDEKVSLHVSIAGGRKTMGFYAGYALSLYGRAQDRMSHVLVDEKFEKGINFYYPSKNENDFIIDRENKTIGLSKDAQVWLAQIPFVRLKEAVKDKHQLKGEDSFSTVVHKINESFNDVKLKILVHSREVLINDKFVIKNLAPREFAMLHWFADLRKKGFDGIVAPTKKINSKDIPPQEAKYIAQLSEQFKQYYEEFKNTEDIQLDVDKQFFESVKSLLNTALLGHLGLELAEKISLTQNKKGQPFYLNVKPENIEIIDRFKN
ncbi:CRISPR-associated ring nuclease Csm6 [Acinetobacter baumannii]|uniref:CRISPR-associated ring nuclease Csm6 n=1 Tax=Acinetobacter baumannii TaxID=470 RepID=UPI00112EE08A|nr:CRISPR-associated ring nuclease Csm6 [Acinetobacter baumannii]TPS23237.1 TIGR02584 family CRISPR-associated protein [Acinetobacter baumannii]HEO1826836.1 TIGR02584 family CRISPR-associated protein [Acinetobacter baumannii]